MFEDMSSVHLHVGACTLFLVCFFFLFIWLCWVFIAAKAFLAAVSKGGSLIVVFRLLTAVASRCRARALERAGFGS